MSVHRPKKRFGQHFLESDSVIKKIIAFVRPSPGDCIVEIGPGQGSLTWPLARSGAEITAVEFDRDLVPMLRRDFEEFDNVTIIEQDFLKFDPVAANLTRFKLVGNLPYNITSPVLDWLVKYRDRIDLSVLMMQREIAARVTATPGGRDWSPLSIFMQIHFETKRSLEVGPEHFSPPPDVHSTVVTLTPKKSVRIRQMEKFEQVVRAAFTRRRKQLVNNLVPGIVPSNEQLCMILDELDLVHTIRAEEISIEQFLMLTESIVTHNF